ncbi:hypothetical protein EKO04_001266 [Ascochyta lentis]|uniref:C3H1-type domain-containing protein n=1 Tax=Ascochyta lentis TaxID=205686 RepID=A0A8H7JAE4_9PLEO|nr:hypothetical protein EKO04_001266 [Ascochyta lentis]
MTDNTDGNFAARLTTLGAEANNALQAVINVAHVYGQTVEERRRSHEELLVEHRALQQELTELKNAQRVHGGERVVDPYVVVLIDAHSHMFQIDLLRQSTNGGSKTAKVLKDQVEQYIGNMSPGAGTCRIVVRVYANLKGLDEDDKGSRTLAGFAAGFSREDSFFDFVDVGDEKIVKSKIVDLFKVSVKDPQCRHTHSQFQDKLSYIKGSVSDPGIENMRLRNVAFSQVFRANKETNPVSYTAGGVPSNVLQSGACWDFQNGECFRKGCKYKHIIAWAAPKRAPSIDTGSMYSCTPPQPQIELPKTAVTGMIPVNPHGQRLDIYMSPPSNAQWARYTARTKVKKLCNAFHLQGFCSIDPCEFDHSQIDGSLLEVLAFVAKGRPCKRRGACRHLDCDKGHVCQKPACTDAGKKVKGCMLGRDSHGIDLKVDKWASPDEDMREDVRDGFEPGVDQVGGEETAQFPYDEDAPLIIL